MKETAVKKQKTNRPKKEKANGNIEEVTAAEISSTSADNKETASAEEDLLKKERIRGQFCGCNGARVGQPGAVSRGVFDTLASGNGYDLDAFLK